MAAAVPAGAGGAVDRVPATNLTYAELVAGFGVSPAVCWRDVAEGISVLADWGRRISLTDVARLAVKMGWDYLIVDGVHVPAVTFGRKTGGICAAYADAYSVGPATGRSPASATALPARPSGLGSRFCPRRVCLVQMRVARPDD